VISDLANLGKIGARGKYSLKSLSGGNVAGSQDEGTYQFCDGEIMTLARIK